LTHELEAIRKRIFGVLKNVLILSFALILFSTIRPELASFLNFKILGFQVTSGIILDIISLIFVIYFGYFILVDLKFFLDLINKSFSARLGEKEHGQAKNITYDVAVVISLVLVSSLLAPVISSIPDVGGTVGNVINIIFIGIGFFMVYHLAHELYYFAKNYFEKISHVASRQKTKHETKLTEGKND
jgi:hypothetical protein